MFRSSCAVLAVVAVLAGVGSARGADAPAGLQGKWKAVSGSSRGEALKAKDLAGVNLTVAGDTLAFPKGGPVDKMVIAAVDASKDPATIDLTISNGKETSLGLYKLDGDKLELCVNSSFAFKAEPRPKLVVPGADVMYIRYERQK